MKRPRHFILCSFVTIAVVAAAATVLYAAPALAANTAYWTNFGNNTISFANLDNTGGGGQLNITGATPNGTFGTAIDSAANKIYWANDSNNTISFANLSGSGGGQLNIIGATPNVPFGGLGIDPAANKIYWANQNGNTISFANLDNTGGGGQLNTGGAEVSGPVGVAIDPAANKIYWVNNFDSTIWFANLDNTGGGGQLNTKGATVDNPYGEAIDPAANRIYWANSSDDTIDYANLDNTGGGGQLNTTGATLSDPVGVAVDHAANKIYIANYHTNTISFANLDNTGGGQLNTTGATLNEPSFPALLKVPSGTGAPVVSGGSTPGSTLSCSQGSWAADQPGSFLSQAPASYSYSWTRNGAPISGATSSSVTASAPGQYVCHVTATNHAGSATQASATHTIPLSCKLKPKTAHVVATTLAQAAKKHKKAPKGQLKLTVKCNETGKLKASGKITAVITVKSGKKHKHKTKHYTIKLAHKSITAGKSATLTVKVPKAALSALKGGAKESIVFTLTVTDSTGSITTTAKIKHLKLGHK